MDEQRITVLADFIDQLPDEHFSMTSWNIGNPYNLGVLDHKTEGPEPWMNPKPLLAAAAECGTRACIAGWACIIFCEPQDFDLYGDTAQNARYLLDLDEDQADALFTPSTGNDMRAQVHLPDLSGITRQRAVKMLRLLAETGQVFWNEDCLCAFCDPDN